MIEKFAGICRTSWSEILDLNHTSKSMMLGRLKERIADGGAVIDLDHGRPARIATKVERPCTVPMSRKPFQAPQQLCPIIGLASGPGLRFTWHRRPKFLKIAGNLAVSQ
jgi:hypothetical protein